jgi:hypothetical protein
VVLDLDQLQANVAALLERYQAIDAVDWRLAANDVRDLGSGIWLAEVGWSFLDASRAVLYCCDTSYLLTGGDGVEGKVMAVIAHNENVEYQKAYQKRFRRSRVEVRPTAPTRPSLRQAAARRCGLA